MRAAENIGLNGKGKDGGAGFCELAGREKGELLLAALVKLVPVQVKTEANVTANGLGLRDSIIERHCKT